MDPLSIAASIVGMIGTAAQVANILQGYISRNKDAPGSIANLKSDLDIIGATLKQLRQYLLRKLHANPSGAALVLVDQVVVILSSCVLTFSELEDLVKRFDAASKRKWLDHLWFAAKSDTIRDVCDRVQSRKTSLILILTIMEAQSNLEVEKSIGRLSRHVELLVSENQLLRQRLVGMRDADAELVPEQAEELQHHERTIRSRADAVPTTSQSHGSLSSLEEELEQTWVYKRAMRRGNTASVSYNSSTGKTALWSLFSGLSLSKASNISAVALPIYATDISNATRYQFGQTFLRVTLNSTAPCDSNRSAIESVDYQQDLASTNTNNEDDLPTFFWLQVCFQGETFTNGVFGQSPSVSIRYAGQRVRIRRQWSWRYIDVCVPVVVARLGEYLRDTGVFPPFLMHETFEEKQVEALRSSFDQGPEFGKSLDLNSCSVLTAAICLVRYFKTLPVPIIPYRLFKKFCPPVDSVHLRITDVYADLTPTANDARRAEGHFRLIHQAIRAMEPADKDLLLYLLDFLAHFVHQSQSPKSLVRHLVRIFQPCILAPQPDEAQETDQEYADAVCAEMVRFVDELVQAEKQRRRHLEWEGKRPLEPARYPSL